MCIRDSVYTVTVTDDFGASVTQPVTIVIQGTNDPPEPAPTPGLLGALSGAALFLEATDASAQDLLPRSGTVAVADSDIGDTLTATIFGTPTLTYSGGALPPGADLSALTALSALTLGSATSNGGTVDLDWTYDPAAANLDFLRRGERLTVQYGFVVSDGESQSLPQSLTFIVIGTNAVSYTHLTLPTNREV